MALYYPIAAGVLWLYVCVKIISFHDGQIFAPNKRIKTATLDVKRGQSAVIMVVDCSSESTNKLRCINTVQGMESEEKDFEAQRMAVMKFVWLHGES